MSQRLNNLNEIIGVLKSGATFYRKASRQAQKPEREVIFVEHADLREKVARELSAIVEDAGGEVPGGSALETAARATAQVGAIFGDTDRNLVHGLEEHEDRTLQAFRNAVHHKDNERDEPILRDYMHQFELSHERMRQLKEEV